MRHIQGSDRAQTLLLPASVEDYVGEDNPVRAIEAFVDGFDLARAGFVRVEAKDTGRPGYHPGDLLKLYLYGYLNRVRSSRRLEAECHRNLEVIWLLRGLRPDFKTIADFRRENAPAFKAAFRRFVYLCRQLDLFGRELLAVDGTRLKAVNSQERNFTREKLKTMLRHADERLAGYLAELAKADDQESGPSAGTSPVRNLAEKIATLQKRRDEYAAIAARMERTGETQVSLTDPDSRGMATYPEGGRGLQRTGGRRCQAQAHRRAGGHQRGQRPGAVSSDGHPGQGGAGRGDDPSHGGPRLLPGRGTSRRARRRASPPSCPSRSDAEPPPARASSPRKRSFTTPKRTPTAAPTTRPCGHATHWVKDGHRVVVYYDGAACRRCPIKAQCTSAKRWRQIARWEGEAVLDAMAARLAANPQMTRTRRNTVEHPFGTIKHAMNQGHFLMKGLRQVRAEFSLSALAYNLLRAVNIVGVKALVEAPAAALTRPRQGRPMRPRLPRRVFTSACSL